MKSIVLELQHDALESTKSITDLLRKALVVARKLNLPPFEAWINAELNGYSNGAEIPEYRTLHGQVRAWNQFRGWQPAFLNDTDIENVVTHRRTGQAISELQNLADRVSSGSLQIPFTGEHGAILRQLFNDNETEFSLFVGASSVARIIDLVRTTVLNWSLQLEEDGVLGENLSFTKEEKKAVASSTTYQNINNFHGEVKVAQIQQSSPSSSQMAALGDLNVQAVKEVVERIKEGLPGLSLGKDDAKSVRDDVATIDIQLESPKPKSVIIRESLKSIRTVLEGLAGNVAAQLLLIEVGKLLGP